MECDDGSEVSSRFTAAEKTELWDRWQRESRSEPLGERLVSRPHLSITRWHRTVGYVRGTASLAVGTDALGTRGDLQGSCSAPIAPIDGEAARSLGLDGEPRTQAQWRL